MLLESRSRRCHGDCWTLDLDAAAAAAGLNESSPSLDPPPPPARWERVPKAGLAPAPRSGGAWAVAGAGTPRHRALLLCGTRDRDAGRDGDLIVSEMLGDASSFHLGRRRWFPLAGRPPPVAREGGGGGRRAGAKKKGGVGHSRAEGGDGAPEPPLAEVQPVEPSAGPKPDPTEESGRPPPPPGAERAAVVIQSRWRGSVVRRAYKAYRVGGVLSELLYSPASWGVVADSDYPRPRGRLGSLAVVAPRPVAGGGKGRAEDLWLWGGVVEAGGAGETSREVALDDLWRCCPDKADGWELVAATTVGVDQLEGDGDSVDTRRSSSDGEGDDLDRLPKFVAAKAAGE